MVFILWEFSLNKVYLVRAWHKKSETQYKMAVAKKQKSWLMYYGIWGNMDFRCDCIQVRMQFFSSVLVSLSGRVFPRILSF